MKKKILIIVSVTFILLGGFLLFRQFKLNERIRWYEKYTSEVVGKSSLCSDRLLFMNNNLFQNYGLHGLMLNNELQYTTNMGKKEELRNLVGTGKIIFRFSKSDCMDCVYKVLPLLDTLGSLIGSENIIVSAEGYNRREMVTFGDVNNIEPIMFVEPSDFLNGNEVSSPVFFYAGPDLHVSCFFSPDEKYPSITKQYFKIISKLFSQ